MNYINRESLHVQRTEKWQYISMIYKFNKIIIKIPAGFLAKLDRLIF